MHIGKVIKGIFEFLFKDMIEGAFAPLFELLQLISISPETIGKTPFVDPMFSIIQPMGLALLLLTSVWAGFRSMTPHLGTQTEEPQIVMIRIFISGFLMLTIKDILLLSVRITNDLITFAFSNANIVFNGGHWQGAILHMLTGTQNILYTLLGLIIFFNIIMLVFKMYKRNALCMLLIVVSPLAVCTIPLKTLEGFWQGFMKLFIGNLVIQVVQIICVMSTVACLNKVGTFSAGSFVLAEAAEKGGQNIFLIMIIIAILSVTNMLEDIIRDMSISVGIGRDMNSAFNRIQSGLYTLSILKR